MGLPAVLIELVDHYGGPNFSSRDSLGKIIAQIGNKMGSDEQFAKWVGKSIKPAWMVSYFGSVEALEF